MKAGFVFLSRASREKNYLLAISFWLNFAQQAEEDIHGLAPSFS